MQIAHFKCRWTETIFVAKAQPHCRTQMSFCRNLRSPSWLRQDQSITSSFSDLALSGGVDLTFAPPLAASPQANVKSKTPPAPYICQWSFDSNIRKMSPPKRMPMLESDH